MTLATLEKRVRTLEIRFTGLRRNNGRSCRSGEVTSYSTAALLKKIMDEAWRLKELAEAAGEHRLALACLHSIYQFAEFAARLAGELDDRSQTNVLNVCLDPATATRIAETYLNRDKLKGPQNEFP